MSARTPGAHTWWARSTIAIKAALAGALLGAMLLPAETSWADDSIKRLVRSVHARTGRTAPSLARVAERCESDIVCAARVLAQAIGDRARLEAVPHPTTDRIRWVTTTPSVADRRIDDQGTLSLRLTRFGRKAEREVREAIAAARSADAMVRAVVLDLRGNRGGDFDRMLRVAALFTGPRPAAVLLHGQAGVSSLAVPDGDPAWRERPLRLWVDGQTASSAEVLAALLKVHAGAQIVGNRTMGKDYLTRVVAVSHDLRLLVPAERIEVPGISFAGGLAPDVRRVWQSNQN